VHGWLHFKVEEASRYTAVFGSHLLTRSLGFGRLCQLIQDVFATRTAGVYLELCVEGNIVTGVDTGRVVSQPD
jgi:hypothetical protein